MSTGLRKSCASLGRLAMAILMGAIKVWLARRQMVQERHEEKQPWSEAFRGSAVVFVDQLIDENQALFEEMARL